MGGGGILGGITWFLGVLKGGSVITENPDGGRWKVWKDSEGGTTQICSENEEMGGDRESHQKLLGGITSVN